MLNGERDQLINSIFVSFPFFVSWPSMPSYLARSLPVPEWHPMKWASNLPNKVCNSDEMNIWWKLAPVVVVRHLLWYSLVFQVWAWSDFKQPDCFSILLSVFRMGTVLSYLHLSRCAGTAIVGRDRTKVCHLNIALNLEGLLILRTCKCRPWTLLVNCKRDQPLTVSECWRKALWYPVLQSYMRSDDLWRPWMSFCRK